MDALKLKRKCLRSSFTASANKLKQYLATNKDAKKCDELLVLNTQLKDKFSRLQEIQNNISSRLLENDETAAEYEEDFEAAEEYRDDFLELNSKIETLLKKYSTSYSKGSTVRAWEMSRVSESTDNATSERTLEKLMYLLHQEVESEEMIRLDREETGKDLGKEDVRKDSLKSVLKDKPTVATLFPSTTGAQYLSLEKYQNEELHSKVEKLQESFYLDNLVNSVSNQEELNNWRSILGDMNSANLPSRPCVWAELLWSKWWEGPEWFRDPENTWPNAEITISEETTLEKRKTVVASASFEKQKEDFSTGLLYISSNPKIIWMVAWILRFHHKFKEKTFKDKVGLD